MALLLPFLLMFIFGIIEIARFWAAAQAVTHAAREGARIMVLPDCQGCSPTFRPFKQGETVRDAALRTVNEYLSSTGLDPKAATVAFIEQEDYSKQERKKKVGITITYQFATPLPAILMHGQSPVPIVSASIMEHE